MTFNPGEPDPPIPSKLHRLKSSDDGHMPDNGICERFHRTVLQEFYQVAFRKRIYGGLEPLQADLDAWVADYNERRPRQGRWCYGKTPLQTFVDTVPLAKEKMLAAA
jgi:Integrase core domain